MSPKLVRSPVPLEHEWTFLQIANVVRDYRIRGVSSGVQCQKKNYRPAKSSRREIELCANKEFAPSTPSKLPLQIEFQYDRVKNAADVEHHLQYRKVINANATRLP